jgi:hypothetical protein
MATPPDSEHSELDDTAFGSPFDDSDADIVLRSSDKLDFMVYKVILSKASPVFKTMFSLPQPDTNTQVDSRRPVVDLAENSDVVAILLSVIYPHTLESDDLEELSLNDLIAALDMARKYDMATASRRLLLNFECSKAIEDSPLEAFCAAYSRELGEAAQIAARASLKYRLNLDDIGDSLEHTNGPAFFRLWKYHRACSAAAVEAISSHNFTWIPAGATTWWTASANCHCPIKYRFTLGAQMSRWVPSSAWSDYLDRACDALREHPCSKAVTNPVVIRPSYQVKMCDGCRQLVCGLPEFSRYLGEEVDRVVSKVRGLLSLS